VQIGALTGVAGPAVGLASGLVETMREIGGAVGIAAVSTVLIALTRDAVEIADPAAQQAAAFEGFQSAFVVTVVLAAIGVLVVAIAFPRAARAVRAPSGKERDLVSAPEPAPEVILGRASADSTLAIADGDGTDARFDGLVISTERPEELRAWYGAAFGGEMDHDGASARPLAFGGVQLIFLPHSDVTGPAREPKRILINFRVDDAREHATRLERLGATWIRPVEPEPFGLLGTVADPDGNYVQIAQLTAGSNRTEDEASKEGTSASR
jgi:predicted enzyme related to lactoylglutathione lyase